MIRVPRRELEVAIDALLGCASAATDLNGLKIKFLLSRDDAEKAVLGALSIVGPVYGPVTAADVYFVKGYGLDYQEWPPHVD